MTAPVQGNMERSESLGREFLVWLWFKSETDDNGFDLGEAGRAEIVFERRIVLQAENEQGVERIVCSGDNPHLREARFALTENKRITEAVMRLIIDTHEWSFGLDAAWLNFKSFKTPKIVQDAGENPDGFFYEKMYLVEQAVSAVDAIFATFVTLRLSPEWESLELPALRQWIEQGK
jgi:recombination associated protein RdgC